MDVGCPKCQTEYELDDTRVPEDGVTVKCTTCGHVFRVKRKSLIVTLPVRPDDARARGATAPDELPPAPPSREWKLRQPSGRLLVCRELTTLQKWIIENKVGRDDEISLTGDTWKRLGEIPELASFFQIVDEAAKARTFEAIHGPTPVPMSPMPPAMPASSKPSGLRPAPAKITETWKEPNFSQKFPDIVTEPALSPVPPPPPPPSEPPLPPRTQQRKEELTRRYEPSESVLQKAVGNQPSGSGKWVALVLLLAAAGAAGYYFGVYEPQQHQQVTPLLAPTPVATTPPPQPVVTLDAGPAVVDAGAPDAGQPDAGEPDAGPVDAGAVAAPIIETAIVDAGHAVAAVPPEQPKRSFENILAQADSLRERERVEAAMNLYGMAHEMRPERVEPLAGRGLSLLDLGNAAAAEAAFDQALKLNGRYAPAIMGMAESLRMQGKNARAIEFYQRYLDVLPEGTEASVARNNIERLKK